MSFDVVSVVDCGKLHDVMRGKEDVGSISFDDFGNYPRFIATGCMELYEPQPLYFTASELREIAEHLEILENENNIKNV